MHALLVRPAISVDATDIADIVCELGYPTTAADMAQRLAGILADPTYSCFVAKDQSGLLGVAGASLGRYFERNGVYARLVILAVSVAHRSRGVGGSLVQAVEQWAVSSGAAELFVNSGSHRESAHRFYKRCGFEITGIRLAKSLKAAG